MSSKITVEKRLYSNLELIQSMQERQPETPIHQVDMQLNPTALPSAAPPKRTVQPPLPPPPNPKYVQGDFAAEANETPMPEASFPTPQLDTNSESAIAVTESSPLYEVKTEGALTYFDYFFEEMGTVVPDAEEASASRSKLTMGLVGAGAIAATVVSGLVIGDLWQKSQAPEDGKPKDASLKQDAAQNSARPKSAAPERQEMPRSRMQQNSDDRPTNRPAPRKTSSRQADPLLTAPVVPPAPAIAAPESLALAPTLPPPPAVRRTPTAPQRTPSTWATTNIPQVSVTEAARRQAALAPIAQPETLPTGEMTSRVAPNTLGTPLPPDATSRPNAEPLPPPALNPPASVQPGMARANPDTAAIAAPEQLAPVTADPATRQPTPANEASGLQRLFPARATVGETSDRPATISPESAAVTPERANQIPAETPASRSGVTQKLQDYLNLPKTAPAATPVTLMPLSQQAAAEAGNTTQVGQFTVRQVNPQDYQKEWIASNPSPDDPAIALAYPAYGFIDYQRQVIVVLKDQPDAPLQSQRSPLPNS